MLISLAIGNCEYIIVTVSKRVTLLLRERSHCPQGWCRHQENNGSETWTLTKADTARLQAFHMKAQRRILNMKWYDFVTNDSVRSQTKLTDLPLIIADRRHLLLGHVCRLPPDVPAHNILQHCVNLSQGRCPAPDRKRPPGRPRKTWIQQVKEDHGFHGCTIDSLWSSAQDRSLWR